MKKTWIIIIAIIILIGLPIMVLTNTYNTLVAMDENIASNWKQVENLMQRRYDLIPNLVETTKGYASHEEKVFTDIANARARIGQGGSREEIIEANQELSSAISRLLVIAENYPELQASQQFIRLQDELAGTENRLAVARQDYNNAVQRFNQRIRRFPTSIIANKFGFTTQPYFEMSTDAAEAPKVTF
ncbi:MAG: LemA family protein [Clostridiales bacterium]|nr:LemA family protein [Clostridiales bacterium]